MNPNPDNREITKYKPQITRTKSQIRSRTNSLEFRVSVIVIYLEFVFCLLSFTLIQKTHFMEQSFLNASFIFASGSGHVDLTRSRALAKAATPSGRDKNPASLPVWLLAYTRSVKTRHVPGWSQGHSMAAQYPKPWHHMSTSAASVSRSRVRSTQHAETA